MSKNIIIICIYRSPVGDFLYFLNQLESLLNKIYNPTNEIILCGDFNVNYLNDNTRKDCLNSLLASLKLIYRIAINISFLVKYLFMGCDSDIIKNNDLSIMVRHTIYKWINRKFMKIAINVDITY